MNKALRWPGASGVAEGSNGLQEGFLGTRSYSASCSAKRVLMA